MWIPTLIHLGPPDDGAFVAAATTSTATTARPTTAEIRAADALWHALHALALPFGAPHPVHPSHPAAAPCNAQDSALLLALRSCGCTAPAIWSAEAAPLTGSEPMACRARLGRSLVRRRHGVGSDWHSRRGSKQTPRAERVVGAASARGDGGNRVLCHPRWPRQARTRPAPRASADWRVRPRADHRHDRLHARVSTACRPRVGVGGGDALARGRVLRAHADVTLAESRRSPDAQFGRLPAPAARHTKLVLRARASAVAEHRGGGQRRRLAPPKPAKHVGRVAVVLIGAADELEQRP